MKLHGRIIDGHAFTKEMNFGHGLNELEFETRQLIRGRVNPGASFERNRVIVASDHVGVNAAWTVGLLLKVNLPRGIA